MFLLSTAAEYELFSQETKLEGMRQTEGFPNNHESIHMKFLY